ncbi:hypothetical protein, partial [Paenibacillus dendritiformis]|uniref:hypothetical protein n=1 Tax=Paenibacillus dendritiformis TaxID=130049 RepID=UPI001EE64769
DTSLKALSNGSFAYSSQAVEKISTAIFVSERMGKTVCGHWRYDSWEAGRLLRFKFLYIFFIDR